MTSSDLESAIRASPSIHLNKDSSKGFSAIAPHVDTEKLRYVYVIHGQLVLTVEGIDHTLSSNIGMFFNPRILHSAKLTGQCSEIKVVTLME